eukprot:jgi/Picsp_1/5594/NSC_02953-R1_rhodanese homology domain-containing protein
MAATTSCRTPYTFAVSRSSIVSKSARKPVTVNGTRSKAVQQQGSRSTVASIRVQAASSQQQQGSLAASRGQVRNVTTAEFPKLLSEGWIVLDVRPSYEIEKAKLKNAVEIPLFEPDESASLSTLIKKSTAFGMGGWWLGGTHMIPNTDFLAKVQASIPDKEQAKVIVVCQKGLRSLSACEQLVRIGYKTIAWVNGGLDTARPGQVETVDNVDVRLGGVGGLSEVLGWTEVQQENGGGFAGGYQNILKAFAVILALDLVWFIWTILNP